MGPTVRYYKCSLLKLYNIDRKEEQKQEELARKKANEKILAEEAKKPKQQQSIDQRSTRRYLLS